MTTLKRLTPDLDRNPMNPECRDPTLYHITGPGATEAEIGHFLAGLVRLLQPRAVVETGTRAADTTMHLATAVKANGHGRVATIDIRIGSAERAKQRLAGLPADAFCGDATTFDWSQWPAAMNGVDLAFIDGGENRRLEFDNLRRFMPSGAYAAFHDTGNGLPPTRVVEALKLEGHAAMDFPAPRGLTLIRLA